MYLFIHMNLLIIIVVDISVIIIQHHKEKNDESLTITIEFVNAPLIDILQNAV